MTIRRDEIAILADEYVLGLLEASQAAEIEAEMERDSELEAAIAASRERFLPLDTAIQPAELDETLWQRIENALPPQGTNPISGTSKVANDNRSSGGWRTAALSAIAATLVMAAGLVWSLNRIVEPVVIAVLLNETGQVQAVVEDFGNANASVRLLGDFNVPEDKTIQVWTLPSKDMGPVSLGLINGTQSAMLQAPALPAPRDNQLYELTLEQAGGSPTGRPTGPILAKGFAREPL